jgi:sucrose-6-phosphate hydrolase SacC (GH32 family)
MMTGGRLFMGPDKDLQLHIFLDGSCLEVFTSTGQTLTTRVYRGHPPLDCQDAGLHLFAVGGSAVLQGVEAYEVGSCWREVPGAPLDSALHQ